MRLIRLDEADSTNTYVRGLAPETQEDLLVVARQQTAGRGQRGNTWESEPGKNLTFSILHHPAGLPARQQFLLSCALSLAVADVLSRHMAGHQGDVRIKWPNDIYVDNQKICGILIENSLAGTEIAWSILGVGINVNQLLFVSDAPNPVSLSLVTGEEYDLDALLDEFAVAIAARLENIGPEVLREYKSRLWRMNVPARYRLPGGEEFTGKITDVGPDGILSVETGGETRGFYFKEVQFVL